MTDTPWNQTREHAGRWRAYQDQKKRTPWQHRMVWLAIMTSYRWPR